MSSPVCPRCSSTVLYDLACPTWGGDNGSTVMACMGCGNATEFFCSDSKNCSWSYITPFNKYNKRFEQNLANRPPWMTDEIEAMEYPHVEDVRYVWGDYDED